MAHIYKSYKTELQLNNAQAEACRKAAGVSRFTYNWGLQQKKLAIASGSKIPSAFELSRRLNAIKRTEMPWMYEVSNRSPQSALADLDRAFANWYGKRSKFPKFKTKKHGAGGFRLYGRSIRLEKDSIRLPRLGFLKLKEKGYLPTNSRILSASVSERDGRWFVSVMVEEPHPPANSVSSEHAIVGVDLGIKSLATVSDGTRYCESKITPATNRKMKRLRQSVSRKKKGSNNRRKAAHKISRLHFAIANARKDALHKITTTLAKTKRVVCIEDLNVLGMMKNHCLARAISELGLLEFRRQLAYKGSWYGCQVVVADRFFPSSKQCSECGWINENLSLSDREWTCAGCDARHDRDFNASVNLEHVAASLSETQNACGEESSGLGLLVQAKLASMNQE